MHSICQALALLAILYVATCEGFGYSKGLQHRWSQTYKACSGKWQSPIALITDSSIPLPLPAIEMISYHNLLSGPIKIKNNGHSVALSILPGHSQKRLPYVFGGLLNQDQEYELEGLHFHWGSRNNKGSEHTLNGIRFPMEMHIIHRNMKYATQEKAMNFKDGLTVLGIFFQVQDEDNEKLNPILDTLPNLRWADSSIVMNSSITLASLMPHDTEVFYTYRGSLTTPPCNEAVTWIIFATPVPISYKQMEKFRDISQGEEILVDNFRQIQKRGNRNVFVRRLDPKFASSKELRDLDVGQLKWQCEEGRLWRCQFAELNN